MEGVEGVVRHAGEGVERDNAEEEAVAAGVGEGFVVFEEAFDEVEAAGGGEAGDGVLEGVAVLDEETVGGIGMEKVEECVGVCLGFQALENGWFEG